MTTMKEILSERSHAESILKGVLGPNMRGVRGIGGSWNDDGDPVLRIDLTKRAFKRASREISSKIKNLPVVVIVDDKTYLLDGFGGFVPD